VVTVGVLATMTADVSQCTVQVQKGWRHEKHGGLFRQHPHPQSSGECARTSYASRGSNPRRQVEHVTCSTRAGTSMAPILTTTRPPRQGTTPIGVPGPPPATAIRRPCAVPDSRFRRAAREHVAGHGTGSVRALASSEARP
jgi:hypothetical protein